MLSARMDRHCHRDCHHSRRCAHSTVLMMPLPQQAPDARARPATGQIPGALARWPPGVPQPRELWHQCQHRTHAYDTPEARGGGRAPESAEAVAAHQRHQAHMLNGHSRGRGAAFAGGLPRTTARLACSAQKGKCRAATVSSKRRAQCGHWT